MYRQILTGLPLRVHRVDKRCSDLLFFRVLQADVHRYKVSFNKTFMLEKFCSHSIAVQDHPVDVVRSSHCYTKCAMDTGSDSDCTDFHRSEASCAVCRSESSQIPKTFSIFF